MADSFSEHATVAMEVRDQCTRALKLLGNDHSYRVRRVKRVKEAERDTFDEPTEKSGRRPAFAGRKNMANARINPLRTCWFEFLNEFTYF